ncbi:MAG: septum formation protein Maf [Chlamydiales bacterium]|nr:septum formation protein Maf [Chlamydiales bacterium]
MRLILGSHSPRRKEILGFFSYPFEQISPPFDEGVVPYEGNPIAYATALSRGKAASLLPSCPDAVILAADTCVHIKGRIMEKPADEVEAFEMLRELNGSWHMVYTAVTAQTGEKERTACAQTRVEFHQLSENKLKLYHKAFNGIDKAGGYGIQQAGSLIVKRMEGCFYNVMGLPLTETSQVLGEMGIDLWRYLG